MSKRSSEEVRLYAGFFKALSNRHRLMVFEQLTKCCKPGTRCSVEDKRCVGDLGASLDIAPSTVSHHLKELHNAGLIEMERCGKQVMCWINPNTLSKLSRYFAQNL